MTAGLRHIAFGLLLKIVIADRAAIVVNTVFDDFKAYSGIAVILAILYTLYSFTQNLWAAWKSFGQRLSFWHTARRQFPATL